MEENIITTLYPEYKSWDELLKCISLTEPDKEIINNDYKKLKQILIDTKKIHIEKVKLCGSFGKKTIIEQKKEIDVVIYITNFNVKNLNSYLNILKDLVNEKNIAKNININKHSIHFEMLSGTKFDLLPCGELPNNNVLSYISSNKYINSSVSVLQKEFINNQSNNYKNIVKIIKFWRYKEEWPDNYYPSSYLLEIIILYIYKKSKNKNNISIMFIELFKLLLNPNEISIIFEIYYDVLDIPTNILSKRPLILDIANPTNNIADNVDFNILSHKSNNILQKIFLNKLVVNKIDETYNEIQNNISLLKKDINNKIDNKFIFTINIPLLIDSNNEYENETFIYSDIEWCIKFYWNEDSYISIYLFANKYLHKYNVSHCNTKYVFEIKDKKGNIYKNSHDYTLEIGGSGYGSHKFIENKNLGLVKSNEYKNFIIPINVTIHFIELNIQYNSSKLIKTDYYTYTNENISYKNKNTIKVYRSYHHLEQVVNVDIWNIKIYWETGEKKDSIGIFISPKLIMNNKKIKGNFKINITDKNKNTYTKDITQEYVDNTYYGHNNIANTSNFPENNEYSLTFEYYLEHYLF